MFIELARLFFVGRLKKVAERERNLFWWTDGHARTLTENISFSAVATDDASSEKARRWAGPEEQQLFWGPLAHLQGGKTIVIGARWRRGACSKRLTKERRNLINAWKLSAERKFADQYYFESLQFFAFCMHGFLGSFLIRSCGLDSILKL